MTINQYRIMIEVFRSFGILSTGKWKHKDFILDLKLNEFYVKALLFEMEFRLGIYLEDNAIEKCCCPKGIVNAFAGYEKTNVI